MFYIECIVVLVQHDAPNIINSTPTVSGHQVYVLGLGKKTLDKLVEKTDKQFIEIYSQFTTQI